MVKTHAKLASGLMKKAACAVLPHEEQSKIISGEIQEVPAVQSPEGSQRSLIFFSVCARNDSCLPKKKTKIIPPRRNELSKNCLYCRGFLEHVKLVFF